MLQINVSQMLKGPIGATRTVTVDDVMNIDSQAQSRVNGEVRLMRTNRSILVQADLDTSVPTECARCLERYNCPLRIHFEEEYFPPMDVTSGLALPGPEETDSFTIDEHLTLDLAEAIRQYALTTLPMKPLCRPDCPGIGV